MGEDRLESEESNALLPQDDAYDALLADLRAIIAAGRGRVAKEARLWRAVIR